MSINREDSEFIYALYIGDIDKMDEMLSKKMVDPNIRDEEDTPVLVVAIEKQNIEAISCLMKYGANVNEIITEFQSGGDITYSPLNFAEWRGYSHIADMLIKNGAKRTDIKLIPYARRGDNIKVNNLLNDNTWIDSTDNGYTALLASLGYGKCDTAKLLIDRGADITVKTNCNDTALHCAAEGGCVEIAEYLLNKGMEIDEFNCVQQTPLILACKNNRIDTAKFLLCKGADVNKGQDTKALIEAAAEGYKSMVQLLIDNGADVNIRTGITALIAAASKGDESIVRLLLSKGADLNEQNLHGGTALIESLSEDNELIAALLIESGANVNIADDNGDTALSIAEDFGYNNIVKLIQEQK